MDAVAEKLQGDREKVQVDQSAMEAVAEKRKGDQEKVQVDQSAMEAVMEKRKGDQEKVQVDQSAMEAVAEKVLKDSGSLPHHDTMLPSYLGNLEMELGHKSPRGAALQRREEEAKQKYYQYGMRGHEAPEPEPA